VYLNCLRVNLTMSGPSETSGNTQHGIGATQGTSAEISAKVDSIKVRPFVGKSYHLWKFKMSQYLDMMDVWDYVNGNIQRPPMSSPEKERRSWKKYDLLARNVLCNGVDEERLQMLTECNTSAEMWKVLQDKYEIVSVANQMRLNQEFHSLKQGSNSVNTYIRQIDAAIDNLRGIGKVVTDEERLLAFLKGLNEEYEVLASILENQDDMTYEKAASRVLTQELKKKKSDSEVEGSESYIAYRGRGNRGHYRGRGRGGGRGRGSNKSELTC